MGRKYLGESLFPIPSLLYSIDLGPLCFLTEYLTTRVNPNVYDMRNLHIADLKQEFSCHLISTNVLQIFLRQQEGQGPD